MERRGISIDDCAEWRRPRPAWCMLAPWGRLGRCQAGYGEVTAWRHHPAHRVAEVIILSPRMAFRPQERGTGHAKAAQPGGKTHVHNDRRTLRVRADGAF